MTRLYTKEEIIKAFNFYNTDKDDPMNKEEFVHCVGLICGLDKTTALEWFDEVDVDGNGTLDEEEFAYVIRQIERETNDKNKFVQLWNQFDEDENDFLDRDEFGKLWKTFLPNLTEEQLDAFFKRVNKNNNGKVDFIEYMDIASYIDFEMAQYQPKKTKGKSVMSSISKPKYPISNLVKRKEIK